MFLSNHQTIASRWLVDEQSTMATRIAASAATEAKVQTAQGQTQAVEVVKLDHSPREKAKRRVKRNRLVRRKDHRHHCRQLWVKNRQPARRRTSQWTQNQLRQVNKERVDLLYQARPKVKPGAFPETIQQRVQSQQRSHYNRMTIVLHLAWS